MTHRAALCAFLKSVGFPPNTVAAVRFDASHGRLIVETFAVRRDGARYRQIDEADRIGLATVRHEFVLDSEISK